MVLGAAAPFVLRPPLLARFPPLNGFACAPPTARRRSPHPLLTATTARDNWENKRAGDPEPSGACKDATQKLLFDPDDECAVPNAPLTPYTALHRAEFRALQLIQKLPALMPLALGVHYSLRPKIITPLLALIVWLISLPRGASLIIFVCASDLVNTAVKWAVQRPRPRWILPDDAGLLSPVGAWEVDLSFPSAHTQFFGGLAFCACAMWGGGWAAGLLFGIVVGLTRSYLSVHWPTDTLAGLLLGGGLGGLWGTFDPYAVLLRAGSPLLSLGFATAFSIGLLCLMLSVRQAVPPVANDVRALWYNNAMASLPPGEYEEAIENPRRRLKPRSLKDKIPMLATVWCALALTGLYPAALTTAAAEPLGPLAHRIGQTAVGLGGLGAVGELKNRVGRLDGLTERSKGALKALTYVAICAWTFLLSQRAHHGLLAVGRRVLGG